MLVDAARLASQQGRLAASLHPHRKGGTHRGQPSRTHSPDVQAIQRFDGYVPPHGPHIFPLTGKLLVQLLHKLSIRGVNGPEKLLKVIKVRVSQHVLVVLDRCGHLTLCTS